MNRQSIAALTIAKSREKIKLLIQEGKYYEAHQLSRTIHFRLVNARKFDEAISLLYDCATMLLQCRQYESGMDLSLLLLEVMKKQSLEFNPERANATCTRLATLFTLMDNRNRESPVRIRFKKAAIAYIDNLTVTTDTDRAERNGVVIRLQHEIAVACWKQSNYSESRFHFERTNDGESFGKMLAEYQAERGYGEEVAAFGLQAVLTLLVLSKPLGAARCLHAYCLNHPRIRRLPPMADRPLLNFAYFLLLAVARTRKSRSASETISRTSSTIQFDLLFATLCSHYAVALERDTSYREQLDIIGQLYFGLPAPQRPQTDANQFSSLLNNVFQLLGGVGGGSNSSNSSRTVESATLAPASTPTTASRSSNSGNALTFGSMFRGMLADMIGEENMSEDEPDSLLD